MLWADRIGTLKEGLSYHLKSVAERQYRNQKYMSVLEHTTDFEKVNDIGPVNEGCVTNEKNIVGEISSVLSFERHLSCPECKSKVQHIDTICGQCTKCSGAVKLSKCPTNMLTKVKLEDNEGKFHFATMFSNTILAIIEKDEGNVSTSLLQTSQMVFTIDNRDIVTKEPGSEEQSCQVLGSLEPEDGATAAIIAMDDDQPKTWREDPTVE